MPTTLADAELTTGTGVANAPKANPKPAGGGLTAAGAVLATTFTADYGPVLASGITFDVKPVVAPKAGTTGTGAVLTSGATAAIPARLVSGTGAVRAVTIDITGDAIVPGGIATGEGAAYDPASFSGDAEETEVATGVGDVLDCTVTVSAPGVLITATGTTPDLDHIGWTAGLASGVGVVLPSGQVPVLRYLFTPPTRDVVPPIAYDVPPLGNRLMRYYRNRPEGRVIWVLPDESFTFDQPYPTILPEVGARGDLFPAVPTPASGLGTSTSNLIEVTYLYVYLGGHEYIIDVATADRLRVFLTDNGHDPDDSLVGLPGGEPPPGNPSPGHLTWNEAHKKWNHPLITWNG